MRKDPEKYRHGDLANALVLDALELIKERPAEELSLRELAERAGVSPRAPYVHFPSKADLLRAVTRRGFEILAEESKAAGFDLVRLGEVYVEFASKNPHLYRLMFAGNHFDPLAERVPDDSYSHLIAAIRHNSTGISEEECAVAGLALWSLVHGFADLQLEGLVTDTHGPAPKIKEMVMGIAKIASALDQ
ncbi:MAG: TetR/AcrR family transcriptional regulator [Armatimonadetes bacterium]|nr:TetR/AcrR family transcriptional regulator [Armatimonadota bacterium]